MHSRPAIIFCVSLFLSSLLLTGCSGVLKGQPNPMQFQGLLVKALVKKYSKPNAIPTGSVSFEERNRILNDFIYLTDVNFHKFTAAIYQGRALFETGNDITLLGLSGAGALVPAAATKAILAAIAGGIAGAHVSINKNFFQERATAALIAKMEASRKSVLAQILKSMKESVADYPLSRGFSDITDYYNAGTIIGALNDIATVSGEEKIKAQAQINTITDLTFQSDKATAELEHFWKPDGKSDPVATKKLNDWLKANGISVSIASFLHSKEYADKRSTAVHDLLKNNNP